MNIRRIKTIFALYSNDFQDIKTLYTFGFTYEVDKVSQNPPGSAQWRVDYYCASKKAPCPGAKEGTKSAWYLSTDHLLDLLDDDGRLLDSNEIFGLIGAGPERI